MQIWALIVDCFREALDRKIFWVMVIISGIIAAAMACVGLDSTGVSLFFGLWRYRYDSPFLGLPPTGIPKGVVAGIAINLMDFFMGWIGGILAIIATAGTFPTLMERGAIDVVLAKPLPRWKLFLGKYLGSMVFIAAQSSLFIGLTFLVIGLRWRTWMPGYLLGVPLMVILYSYLYGACVLAAVITRSTLTAVIISLAAWFVFSIPQTVYATVQVVPAWKNSRFHQAAKVARWILPKTQDVAYIAGRWAGAGIEVDFPVEPQMPGGFAEDEQMRQTMTNARRLSEEQLRVSAAKSIGSSLAFELVCVLLALRRFSKADF